ncbi:hypothetical protein CHARACLAT_025927 [Characodon lateralis]|uniref:Uncharacterized protein n=1 Tax=Characodon lateralis TaxID=208331 RepID=A0ABU7EMC3_9TELE|nr:hypothetical protein [Characodon lateralis]
MERWVGCGGGGGERCVHFVLLKSGEIPRKFQADKLRADKLRAYLLSCVSLLDEATKEATTFIYLLFFNIESTPGSVSALSSQTLSRSWQLAAHTFRFWFWFC